MTNVHVIDPEDLRPADVLVTKTSLLLSALDSRQSGGWRVPALDPLAAQIVFRADGWGSRFVVRGNGCVVKPQSCLTLEELDDATNLLLELRRSAIPRLSHGFDPDAREVFFSEVNGWDLPGDLPMSQLRAIWSEKERALVFFSPGLASSFLPWSKAFDQPQLTAILQRLGDRLVVIVPSIVPMSARLLQTLLEERSKIWQRIIGNLPPQE